jgi:hypothetical protein
MIENGHQKGVVVDATFGTNDKKVMCYVKYIIHVCGLIH